MNRTFREKVAMKPAGSGSWALEKSLWVEMVPKFVTTSSFVQARCVGVEVKMWSRFYVRWVIVHMHGMKYLNIAEIIHRVFFLH